MLHTNLCEAFGIECPIISAPMAGPATVELASAVSEAGGPSFLGTVPGLGPSLLRQQVRQIKGRTDKPFGVGSISSWPGIDELMAATSHSFSGPTPHVPPARAAGIETVNHVQQASHAEAAVAAGVEAIAAQGTRVGVRPGDRRGFPRGHRGSSPQQRPHPEMALHSADFGERLPEGRSQLRHAFSTGDETQIPNRLGPAAGLVRRVESAGDNVQRLVAEAGQRLRHRPSELPNQELGGEQA